MAAQLDASFIIIQRCSELMPVVDCALGGEKPQASEPHLG